MKTLLTIGFCLLVSNLIKSQTPLLREIKLADDGRALEITNAITDRHGVIWISSKTGLFLFKGNSLKKLKVSEKQKEEFTTIFEDKKGRIWAGTASGSVYSYRDYELSSVFINGKISKFPITQFLEDYSGNLWIGTYGGGIFILENNSVISFNKIDGLGDQFIYCLEISKSGNVLCGTDLGIYFCSFQNRKKVITKTLTVKNGLADNIVKDLEFLNESKLCIGTQDKGVQIYDSNSDSFAQLSILAEGMVNTICHIDGEIWAGFDDRGIEDYEFDVRGRRRNLELFEHYRVRRIQKIIQTRFKNQIIIAENKLFITPGEWYERLDLPEGYFNTVPKAISISKDRLVLAFKSQIFYKSILGNWIKLKLNKIDLSAISYLHLDEYDRLWVGSLTEGVHCYDFKNKNTVTFNSKNGLVNNTVFCLYKNENYIFYGCMNGIGKININKMKVEEDARFKATRGLYIYDIELSSKGEIYFGTDGLGIGIIKNNKLNLIKPGNDNDKNIIQNIAISKDGRIWFSSLYFGLYELIGNQVKLCKGLKSVNENGINTLFSDKNNNIISISDDFISFYNPTSKKQVLTQSDFEFDGNGLTNALISSDKNAVYIASKNGIFVFQPDRFKFMDKIPTGIINRLVYLEKFKETTSGIQKFKSSQDHISFEVLYPYYFNTEKVQYEYYLEGDNIQHNYTSSNLISFSGLKPGRYKFKVRGNLLNITDNAVPWSIYEFSIRKPFYARWWFISIIFLSLISVSYWYYFFTIKKKKKIEEIEKQKLFQEVKVLNNQINPHFLFNSLSNAASLVENKPIKAIEYIESLSDFYRTIVTFKDELMVNLEDDLNLGKIFIYLQNIRFSGNIILDIDSNSISKIKNLKIPPLSIQILLENAVKHNAISTDNPLKIYIYFENEFLIIKNNMSFKRTLERSTGSGLGFVKERFKILSKSEPEIFSDGHFFTVKLPLIK